MKEAAGEANMTVVTIVLIAIVLAAGTFIVTGMMDGLKGNKQTECASMNGAWNGSQCIGSDGKVIKLPSQQTTTPTN